MADNDSIIVQELQSLSINQNKNGKKQPKKNSAKFWREKAVEGKKINDAFRQENLGIRQENESLWLYCSQLQGYIYQFYLLGLEKQLPEVIQECEFHTSLFTLFTDKKKEDEQEEKEVVVFSPNNNKD